MREYYLIGSLRNPEVIPIVKALKEKGIETFSSWHAAGPAADDCWRDYEKARGLTYQQALKDYAAQHVFEFDRFHLDRCDGAILLCPAGKSGHMELGYTLGQGKPGFIYLPGEPERWDVMYNFATAVCTVLDELVREITNYERNDEVPF
jgi:nucleoside 2-deoxyribosyltransferase